jgi:hypothetical protein
MGLFWNIILAVSIAHAQEPMQQALSEKLLREISDNVTCQSNVIELKKQVAALQKQLEERSKPDAEHKP